MKIFSLIVSTLMVLSGLASVSLVSAEELRAADSSALKTNRIINGVKSSAGAWPSTVALLNTNIIKKVEAGEVIDTPFAHANYQAQFCGATLIASKWVMTAAHCIVDSDTEAHKTPSDIVALIGTNDLVNTSSGSIRASVKRIIVHPYYNNETTDTDIALLELVYDTSFVTMDVSGNDVPDGIPATVVGWGTLDSDTDDFPKDLYEVEVPIVNRAICERSLDKYSFGSVNLSQNMICAGSTGKDSCSGDSGGPLMARENGEYVVVGISSWGLECAKPDTYGIYTRVSKFKNWIDSQITNTENNAGSSGGGSIFLILVPLLLLRPTRLLAVKLIRKKDS